MAAIHDPDEEVDLHQLALGVKEKLPSFARPLFVRFVKHLDITGTQRSNFSTEFLSPFN